MQHIQSKTTVSVTTTSSRQFLSRLVEKPLLLNFFSGKAVYIVGAHKASSLAIDASGAVYEWGSSKYNVKNDSTDIEKTYAV